MTAFVELLLRPFLLVLFITSLELRLISELYVITQGVCAKSCWESYHTCKHLQIWGGEVNYYTHRIFNLGFVIADVDNYSCLNCDLTDVRSVGVSKL